MTGWTIETDRIDVPAAAVTPTPATLAEVATAAQRWQLSTLIDALAAHPDLAAQVYAALRRSP